MTAGSRSAASSGTPRLFPAATVLGSRERLCRAEPGSALWGATGQREKGKKETLEERSTTDEICQGLFPFISSTPTKENKPRIRKSGLRDRCYRFGFLPASPVSLFLGWVFRFGLSFLLREISSWDFPFASPHGRPRHAAARSPGSLVPRDAAGKGWRDSPLSYLSFPPRRGRERGAPAAAAAAAPGQRRRGARRQRGGCGRPC